jgi:hypothetical protein
LFYQDRLGTNIVGKAALKKRRWVRFSQGRVTQRQQWDFAEDTALNSCRAAMGRLQLLL